MHAHCYRSGQIELSRKRHLPGTIRIATAPADDLRRKISARARLAYDGETWLVPGIPEADTDDEAEAALVAFRDRMARS